MEKKQIVDTQSLLTLNPDLVTALYRGEKWALEHMRLCESLNAEEPEGFRRPFDGIPRKWCGGSCPSAEGCVVCTLPEDDEFAKYLREYKDPLTLAREGVIELKGKVDLAMTLHVDRMLTEAIVAGVENLEVRIESDGGSSDACLSIYHNLRHARVKTRRAVVKKYARSAAAVILQACDIREAHPDASILIHHLRFTEPVFTLPELLKGERVKEMIAMGKVYHNRILDILMERTKRTRKEIEDAFLMEADMTSAEALTFGLIDVIKA
jgi:ATP-dependent protease ClpP protease subunit